MLSILLVGKLLTHRGYFYFMLDMAPTVLNTLFHLTLVTVLLGKYQLFSFTDEETEAHPG